MQCAGRLTRLPLPSPGQGRAIDVWSCAVAKKLKQPNRQDLYGELGLGSRVSSCEASAHLCEVRALTLLHYCVSGGAVGLALHWGERPAVPRRSKLATTVEHRCATAPI